jgi:general stress protein 26
MGDSKDLQGQEGIQKLRDMVEDINVCMFCTMTPGEYFETRPMATQKVDEQGRLWFLSDKSSDKHQEIKKDRKVQLIYGKPSAYEFLSIKGTAFETRDRKTLDELWTKMAEAWFKGGKDDPNLVAVCVTPKEAYYWDTKHNKMVSLLKIAIATITHKVMDGGIEGVIKP